jgi:NADH-quinone oxidoreductase subunit A
VLNTDYVLRYTPLVLILFVGPIMIGGALVVARLLAPRQAEELKPSTYESGMPSVPEPFTQVNLRYYLFAILFVLFEVEVLFILPWTVVVRELGAAAFAEMMLFLGILLFGLAYAWRKGVLQWR